MSTTTSAHATSCPRHGWANDPALAHHCTCGAQPTRHAADLAPHSHHVNGQDVDCDQLTHCPALCSCAVDACDVAMRPTTHSRTAVQEWSGLWRSSCSCGWEGPSCLTRLDALAAGDSHWARVLGGGR